MTDTCDRDEHGTDPDDEALGSAAAARHVARLTGMSPEAAKTYADFHAGRFARGAGSKDAA